MNNSGRHLAKGKPANPKPVAKKDGKAVITADECDEANSQNALASGTCGNTDKAPSPQLTLASILTAIGKLEEGMMTRFNTLDIKLQLVQISLTDHATRITDLEGCASNHETRITALIITGLPEKAEKGNLTHFVAEFPPKRLVTNNFPDQLKVDRAHCIGV